ncbi:JmjC domain-containing protein 7 [Clydaea vesicula]|uniref:JmjC domain-containing protein 7 n=1 Tax=Clydaea vesicula TaxID=447962 RepID=A0AAD5U0L0_9FUNG|nr:JmjC domain-containing protein 7 [Clydaea vesicula]
MDKLEKVCKKCSKNCRDFGLDVFILEGKPTPLQFSKIVGKNRPALFKGACKNLPAFKLWRSKSYLCDVMKNTKIQLAATPNGLADGITDNFFVLPHLIYCSFNDAIEKFSNAKKDVLIYDDKISYYIQSQNDNLQSDFKLLFETGDVPKEIFWASEVFDKKPDGEQCCLLITNMIHFYSDVQLSNDTIWEIKPLNSKTPWVSVNPQQAEIQPIIVEVSAGDVFYLPSLWYHQVEQESTCLEKGFNATIAVNYWYDLDYDDARFSYFQLLRSVTKLAEGTNIDDDEDDDM